MTNIRPLTITDTHAYRALRREILISEDAQYFSDSFERERALSDQQWFEWCREKREHAILGAFDGGMLVGVIMITSQGGESSPLAEMEAAWVHPQYRGHLGYRLYKAGLDWAKLSEYDYVISFVRNNANASTRLCEALGYVYAYTVKDELWADGSVADTNAYVISLAQATSAERKKLSEIDRDYIIGLAPLTLHAPTKLAIGTNTTIHQTGDEMLSHANVIERAQRTKTIRALEDIQNEIDDSDETRSNEIRTDQRINPRLNHG